DVYKRQTQLGTLIKVKLVEGQTTEDIVNDRRGNPNVSVVGHASWLKLEVGELLGCLLYTSDAADDLTRGDLGGRRITQKKKNSSHYIFYTVSYTLFIR
ncbi:hypothetical protein LKL48_15860, partial [Listeria monocytogenes]